MKKIEEKLKEKWMDKLEENYPEGKAENVDYDVFMDALMKASPVEVWFDDLELFSRYRRTENEIVIPGWMENEEKMKLAIREASYALCHKREQKEGLDVKRRWTTKIMEGAGVYYMVCNYFGLDIKEPLMPDLGEGGRDMYMNMDDLHSFMESVRETASHFIDAIIENMQSQRQKGLKKEYRSEELEDLYMEFLRKDIETYRLSKNERRNQKINFQYYVVNDIHGKETEKVIQYFTDLDIAFKEYSFLPNHLNKQIGMKNMEKQEEEIYLVECVNGWDEIRELKEGLPSEKWICRETKVAMQKAQAFVDHPNTKIAYRMKGGYFVIKTFLNEIRYAIYDKKLKELDGGIYDYPNASIRKAMTAILNNDRISAEECVVINYDEFEKGKMWLNTPMVSNRIETEAELNGLSYAEAEKIVVQEMQGRIKELDFNDELNLYGVRVCGINRDVLSCGTPKIYIDIAVFFNKDIQESDLWADLVWNYMKIGDIPVNIIPVSITDIPSLEDYMQQKDQNLKEKEAPQKLEKNLISNPKSFGDNINEVKHEPGNKADYVREPPNQRKSVIQRLRNRQVQISEKKCKRHKQVTAACKRGLSR